MLVNVGKSLAFIIITLTMTNASADKWRLGVGTETNEFDSDEAKCVVHRIVSEEFSGNFPKWKTICSVNDKQVFEINLGATDMWISNDAQYFVGLSSTGLTDLAYWVVDREGNLIYSRKHFSEDKQFKYCARTKVLKLEWYKTPISLSETSNGGSFDVIVNGCDSNDLSLQKLSLKRDQAAKESNPSWWDKLFNLFK